MTSFLQTFGASAVSPSEVAFAEYSFGTALTLYWPQFSAGQTDIAARFMNMTATANTSLNVTMPDATLVSVGYDVIIFNAGSYTFDVVDADGGAIATIATGQTYYILLNDNTTAAGGWQTVQFGVGTGSASAAALAGAGLVAIAGLLNTKLSAVSQSASFSLVSGNRSTLQVWTGGAGTISLPTAASVGDGFFFAVANNGSGSLTIDPDGSEQIDGESSSIFTQTQSAFIVCSGSAWYTVGKGLQNNFSVTLLNLNVAGSSDVTETSAQAQNVIQQYTGVLTGNINVIVPDTVQLYYVFNNTSGPYTLTVKTAAGTGILITQGAHVILYCDGTNVVNAFTTITSILGSAFYSIGVAGGTPDALTGTASNFVLQLGTVVFFSPSDYNTGPATLNVQGTGDVEIRKIGAAGLVPLTTADLIPTIPISVYYDGTYYVALNIIYWGNTVSVGTDTAIDLSYLFDSIDVSAPAILTLDSVTLLPQYFSFYLLASGGAITLTPDASDSINGLPAGDSYVIPQGGSARVMINNVDGWTIFLLTTPYIADDTTTNATMYPVWVTANSGNLPLKVSSSKMSFNPSTGTLTATAFSGTVTTATNATNIAITDDTTTNATMYPTWVTANTGNLPQKVSSTKMSFNPSTGLLTSTGFAGPLTGNVTGDCSGSSGSTTGNAATATKWATGRTVSITGDLAYTSASLDGSANVTAAGTLATVNSNVGSFTNSSITVNGKGLITAASSGPSSNTYQATPANPTATTSATQVMMGLAGAITPNGSGKIMIVVSGDVSGSSGGDAIYYQARYGTGTAPTNGAAATGTAVGSEISFTTQTANRTTPFSCNAIVSSLTPSTAYWIDLGVRTASGATGTLTNISISSFEIK